MATFKELIKAHLEKMAAQDFAFAERYKLETKSLDECLKYITAQAKKKAKGNCAAIEDAVVYGWAVHYYQEDDVKVEQVKAKVTASKIPPMADESKWEDTTICGAKAQVPKEVKPIKALVKDKKNENKCIEMDLFAGMF